MLPPMWPRPTKPSFVDVVAVISVLPFDRGQVILSRLEVRYCKTGSILAGARKPATAPVTAGLRRVPATATAPGSGVVANGRPGGAGPPA
jgi:hypothetical protein